MILSNPRRCVNSSNFGTLPKAQVVKFLAVKFQAWNSMTRRVSYKENFRI